MILYQVIAKKKKCSQSIPTMNYELLTKKSRIGDVMKLRVNKI